MLVRAMALIRSCTAEATPLGTSPDARESRHEPPSTPQAISHQRPSFSLIDRFALFLEGADAFLVVSAAVHDAAQTLDTFEALGRHRTGAREDSQLLFHD